MPRFRLYRNLREERRRLQQSIHFTTDNAKRVIAKLPFKLAGPPRLTTNSEVATIKYCEVKLISFTL